VAQDRTAIAFSLFTLGIGHIFFHEKQVCLDLENLVYEKGKLVKMCHY
jgi:hypothetical protein